jgi:putative membrane protein
MKLLSRVGLAALTGTLALAVAAPVQAAPVQGTSAPAGHTTAAASTVQAGDLCRQDRRFLRGAHQSNLAEILGGHLALARSQRGDVRDIARILIEHHTMLDRDVRATARRYDVSLPATPSARQLRELLAVGTQPAQRFDRSWLRLQEISHERTLALIDAELRRGCARDVRALARTARPVVVEHLRLVRAALGRG